MDIELLKIHHEEVKDLEWLTRACSWSERIIAQSARTG
jgi:hypothetical protein